MISDGDRDVQTSNYEISHRDEVQHREYSWQYCNIIWWQMVTTSTVVKHLVIYITIKSVCCVSETNNILYQLYFNKNFRNINKRQKDTWLSKHNIDMQL